MATIDQTLISSPKRTGPSCKTLYITFSLTSLFSLMALSALHLTSPNNFQQSPNPASCIAIISNQSPTGIFPTTEAGLRILLKRSMARIDDIAFRAARVYHRINDSNPQVGLDDCVELMDLSHRRLSDTASAVDSLRMQSSAEDVHTWLAGVYTNHVTCLDGVDGVASPTLVAQLKSLIDLAMASVCVFSEISPSNAEQMQQRRDGDFPPWLRVEDRRLLRVSRSDDIVADAVVAKDGSGNYRSIQEAVAMAPENGQARYVIHVKKGRYEEKVVVGKKKKNVMIVGDDMDSTIVTGSLSVADGSTVYSSATFVALGDGFMAQDIAFQNTAGPEKRPAVALLVGADQSVINRCRIDGYHNSLYAHSLRHFYKDSLISGTVDFFFGNALAVFQTCKFITQNPMNDR